MPHPQAAVDGQDGAGDIARLVGGQPAHEGGHIFGVAEALERHLAQYLARLASLSAAVMSVSMKPGATTLTVMLRPPISLARLRPKPTRPAFEAA